jgi:hypothetical protein
MAALLGARRAACTGARSAQWLGAILTTLLDLHRSTHHVARHHRSRTNHALFR